MQIGDQKYHVGDSRGVYFKLFDTSFTHQEIFVKAAGNTIECLLSQLKHPKPLIRFMKWTVVHESAGELRTTAEHQPNVLPEIGIAVHTQRRYRI